MPKVKCLNTLCKFNNYDGKCEKKNITIGFKGCNSFEKNMIYYINLVWEKLENTNMIFPFELDTDLQIGLYYVMELFGLKFKYNTWGNDSFITLHRDDIKDGTALKYSDIIGIEMNNEKWNHHYNKFKEGLLPQYDEDNKNKNNKKELNSKETESTEPKVKSQPYGWLSPTGEFTEGDWGTHENTAKDIINKKCLDTDYYEWVNNENETGNKRVLYRDFLIYEKGYALIHNPSLIGNYKVTYAKNLTNKQKDFLYGYFVDMGDIFKAEIYLTA